jgi:BolA protein
VLYAIISEDVEDSLGKRMSARPAHLKRLQVLQDEGRLVLAGPHPAVDSDNPGEAGFTGSLVVAEFDNLQAAQQWADSSMTSEQIKQLLNDAFKPELLEIIDNSAAHAGHAGAKSGGGHYHVTIVADAFEGKSLVQRHQLIYKALGDMMKQQIHALGINALSPSEETKGSL